MGSTFGILNKPQDVPPMDSLKINLEVLSNVFNITPSYTNFEGGLAQPPLKLKCEWIIAFHDL